jgi:hypothetical protein
MGSADVVENPNSLGFSVIVRHEHLFILYGHLKDLDPAVYVGKRVDAE